MENGFLEQLRILLVDDDEDEYILVRNLSSEINRSRYNWTWVSTKARALSLCEEQVFDLYLIDYRLGADNGIDLVRELVRKGIKAPIILLTGQGSLEIDEAAQQAGAADYLVKGELNASLLDRTIRYALEHKNIQTELERRVQERTQALQLSETRFRTLAETTSAAIFIVIDLKIRYANPAARSVTGYAPNDLIGRNFTELIHPEYRKPIEERGLGNQWVPGLPSRYELKIVRKDLQVRWLDVTTGDFDYEGEKAWIVTAFDITERDTAEKELQRAKTELEEKVNARTLELSQANQDLQKAGDESRKRAEELSALQNATSMLLSTLNLDALLRNILEAACRAILAAEKATLHLIVPETGQLEVRAAIGYHDSNVRRVRHDLKGKNYLTEVIQAGKPLLLQDIFSEFQGIRLNLNSKELQSARSLIAAPLLLKQEPMGALLLTSSQASAFSERDLGLLQSFAATAAAAIHNAQLHDEIQRLAVTDPLTGAYNRRGFFQNGQREWERFHRYGRPLSVIYMDIDEFKSINDAFGHTAGDKVLQAVVDRGCLHMRQVDLIGRLGGDEFGILLPETDLTSASAIAERIRLEVTKTPIPVKRQQLTITATLGVTEAHADIPNLEGLLANADKALYAAKQNGRNQVAML